MPEFVLRTVTEQTKGNVYQHGSLNPSSGGHVIKCCSKHCSRSQGEKVQAPSSPRSNPAAPGKGTSHPFVLQFLHVNKRNAYYQPGPRWKTQLLCLEEKGEQIRCWEAASLQSLSKNWPGFKCRRGDNAENRNPGRLGSTTQAPSEEAEKNNQTPGLGKHLKQAGEQADGEEQLGRHLNHSQTRRTNLRWLGAEQEPGRDAASGASRALAQMGHVNTPFLA